MKTILSYCLITFLSLHFVSAQKLLNNIAEAHAGGQALAIAIKNDGSWFLSGGSDNRAYLWDTKTGKKLKILSHKAKVPAVSFSSDFLTFATACADNSLILWDANTGKPKKIITGHTDEVNCVSFNPFNNTLASGSKDKTVRIWDGAKGTVLTILQEHTDNVTSLCYNPNGLQFASGGADKKIIVWDAATGDKVKVIDAPGVITSLTFSPNGKYLAASVKSSIILWDARSWEKTAELLKHSKQVNTVAFSPDVQFLASAGADKKVIVWDLKTKEPVQLPEGKTGILEGYENEISAVAFSDKGDALVTASLDGSIRIWDLKTFAIGDKKFPRSETEPKLTCSPVALKEANGNGIIEEGDSPALSFTISNMSQGKAYNVFAQLTFSQNIKGLKCEKMYMIGNFDANEIKNVSLPMTVTPELETSAGNINIHVKEVNAYDPPSIPVTFQTKGSVTRTYVMITEQEFSSPSGKAELSVPVTMKLKLKNTTSAVTKNIKLIYSLPAGVLATTKLSEAIELIQPGESKQVSFEFYADKGYTAPELKIGIALEGEVSSNVDQLNLVLKMNDKLPTAITEATSQPVAMESGTTTTGEQHLYRGSGDPLKGLNVSKAKEMVIGDYYAFIVGVDKYSGTWSPLQNAVRDAKAVEAMLKEKYKFEHYRSLYNEQATRESIIKEFEWLITNVKEKDNVFIFYSGHGEFKQEMNKGFWVPVDATTASTSKYISNSDIQTYLGSIKSRHTLLVSDACFSGDIFRGSTVSVPFEASDKYFKEVYNLTSRQAITSGGLEPVMDGGKDGHSVFAYYFLKTLKGNENKYLDASQLFNNVRIPVTNNSEQSPKFSPIKNSGDEGGQFLFIKK